MVTGTLNKQIAADTGCSIRTIQIHRSRVVQKMHAASVADLERMSEALRAAAVPNQPLLRRNSRDRVRS